MNITKNTVPSISVEIDNESRTQIHRHSLQPKSKALAPVNPVRRHHSLGKTRPTNNIRKPSIPVILETDKSDEDDACQNNLNSSPSVIDSNRISFTKKSRRISNISKTSKTSIQNQVNGERGYINYGYDQTSRSSIHGSMASLPVIREQYCCCSRWTRMERNLAFIVAVLAIIIIGLVIAIGVVARHDGPNSFGPGYLSVFKF